MVQEQNIYDKYTVEALSERIESVEDLQREMINFAYDAVVSDITKCLKTGYMMARNGVEYAKLHGVDLDSIKSEYGTVSELNFRDAYIRTMNTIFNSPVGEHEFLDGTYADDQPEFYGGLRSLAVVAKSNFNIDSEPFSDEMRSIMGDAAIYGQYLNDDLYIEGIDPDALRIVNESRYLVSRVLNWADLHHADNYSIDKMSYYQLDRDDVEALARNILKDERVLTHVVMDTNEAVYSEISQLKEQSKELSADELNNLPKNILLDELHDLSDRLKQKDFLASDEAMCESYPYKSYLYRSLASLKAYAYTLDRDAGLSKEEAFERSNQLMDMAIESSIDFVEKDFPNKTIYINKAGEVLGRNVYTARYEVDGEDKLHQRYDICRLSDGQGSYSEHSADHDFVFTGDYLKTKNFEAKPLGEALRVYVNNVEYLPDFDGKVFPTSEVVAAKLDNQYDSLVDSVSELSENGYVNVVNTKPNGIPAAKVSNREYEYDASLWSHGILENEPTYDDYVSYDTDLVELTSVEKTQDMLQKKSNPNVTRHIEDDVDFSL